VWLLFVYVPMHNVEILLKQLYSLAISNTNSWLSGRETTQQTAVPKVPGLIHRSDKDFYVCFFCFVVVVFNFLVQKGKNHYLSWNVAIPFAMLFYYLTRNTAMRQNQVFNDSTKYWCDRNEKWKMAMKKKWCSYFGCMQIVMYVRLLEIIRFCTKDIVKHCNK